MSFPTAPVLDDFDSYGAGAPSSTIWHIGFGDSNACVADGSGHFGATGAGFCGSYWVASGDITGDVEAYYTFNTLPTHSTTVGVYLNYMTVASAGGGAPNTGQTCYTLLVEGNGTSGWRWRLFKVGGGGGTLIANTNIALSVGDKIGVKVTGTTHEVWYCPVSTGVWVSLGTATDSTFTHGWLGFEFNGVNSGKIDNFGGGAPVSSQTLDVGHIASAAVVRGADMAPSGHASLSVGKVPASKTVRGADIAPSGHASLVAGKVPASKTVRGADVTASGHASLSAGKIASSIVVRGADVANAVITALLLSAGKIASSRVVRGAALAGTGTVPMAPGRILSASVVRGARLRQKLAAAVSADLTPSTEAAVDLTIVAAGSDDLTLTPDPPGLP